MFYSASYNGFYLSQSTAPNDAVEITMAEHVALIDGQAKGKVITADADGKPVLVFPAMLDFSDRKKQAKSAIDTAAGNARQRYVSAGQLVEEEYHLALNQTKAWRDAGSPAEDVPPAIGDWATAAGMTAEQAATDIEQTAAAWEQVLITVRNIRLSGKAAVDAATDQGTADDMANVAQPYIDQLDALAP